MLALLGRREEARRHLEAAGSHFDGVPRDLSRAYVLAHLAEVVTLFEDRDAARSVARLLARGRDGPWCSAPAPSTSGRARTTWGCACEPPVTSAAPSTI